MASSTDSAEGTAVQSDYRNSQCDQGVRPNPLLRLANTADEVVLNLSTLELKTPTVRGHNSVRKNAFADSAALGFASMVGRGH